MPLFLLTLFVVIWAFGTIDIRISFLLVSVLFRSIVAFDETNSAAGRIQYVWDKFKRLNWKCKWTDHSFGRSIHFQNAYMASHFMEHRFEWKINFIQDMWVSNENWLINLNIPKWIISDWHADYYNSESVFNWKFADLPFDWNLEMGTWPMNDFIIYR